MKSEDRPRWCAIRAFSLVLVLAVLVHVLETAGAEGDGGAAEATDVDHDPVELIKKGFDAEVVQEVEET